MKVSIGSFVLGKGPGVAVAVRDDSNREDLDRAMEAGAHLVEVRVDQFSTAAHEYVLGELRRYAGLPRIATIRSKLEGGGWNADESARLALFKTVIPECEAVDIELSADQINRDVIWEARQQGRTVIGSFHNFHATPAPASFAVLMEKAEFLEVDILKIAAHCSCGEDLRTLTRLLLDFPEKNLIVLGMGAYGTPSRFLFPALGSLITYTFLGEPTAPGQINLEQTLDVLRVLFPKVL